ncbi:DUF2147 domain-containing protein [Novosphingobium sp. Leaf2]|uniref:DUF2147 domain-containing protein n=1 Tax=Novosphingobium sp. Leaf2 TaxID=1735670 RepID=UPI0006FBEC63|nr:DUF2147 domain-containing protein [Novosphingobium sp. Leaf2]KQM19433.1 hypothetical protein ASE49_04155 [Novosphingobium sp. Leaf2]
MHFLKRHKWALVSAASLTVLGIGPAVAADANTVLGTWHTPTKNGIVEIARCGASICGRLMTSDHIKTNPDLKDTANKDTAQRGRRLKGMQILGGFAYDKNQWAGGTIYNPDDGGTYKATITMAGADTLKLKGCIVWPLCKTQTWTRVR